MILPFLPALAEGAAALLEGQAIRSIGTAVVNRVVGLALSEKAAALLLTNAERIAATEGNVIRGAAGEIIESELGVVGAEGATLTTDIIGSTETGAITTETHLATTTSGLDELALNSEVAGSIESGTVETAVTSTAETSIATTAVESMLTGLGITKETVGANIKKFNFGINCCGHYFRRRYSVGIG